MTIIHVTDSKVLLEETLCEMMDVTEAKALSLETLTRAVARLPLSTTIFFDKIYGRWIFSNQSDDEWPKAMSDQKKIIRIAHKVSGANFTFVHESLDMALAKGIYYYYHTKLKE